MRRNVALIIASVLFSVVANSTQFDEQRGQFIRTLAAEIQSNGANITLELVLARAADFRRRMAELDGHPQARDFGVRRNTRLETGVGTYPITVALLFEQRLNFLLGLHLTENLDGRNYVAPEGYPFSEDRTSIFNLALSQGREAQAGNVIISPRDPAPHLQRAAVAFRAQGSLLESLARLHYHLSVAAPFNRGSAAIAEMVVEALALSLGVEIEYPDEDRVLNAIASARAHGRRPMTPDFVRNLFHENRELDATVHTSGRQAIDQFVHGSSSVDEFVRLYSQLVRLRDTLGFYSARQVNDALLQLFDGNLQLRQHAYNAAAAYRQRPGSRDAIITGEMARRIVQAVAARLSAVSATHKVARGN